MSVEKLHEPVTVGAIFQPSRDPRPAWFLWHGRKIRIRDTNMVWSERQGRTVLYHFSVTDGADTYHLVMNGENHTWHVEGVQLQP